MGGVPAVLSFSERKRAAETAPFEVCRLWHGGCTACRAGRRKAWTYEMSEVVPFPNKMIAKLVKAGYLRPEHRHDADAITSAIANMKQDLRSGGSDAKGPSVA